MNIKKWFKKSVSLLIIVLETAGWFALFWTAGIFLITPQLAPDTIQGIYINKFGLGIFLLYFHFLVDNAYEEINRSIENHQKMWEKKQKETSDLVEDLS